MILISKMNAGNWKTIKKNRKFWEDKSELKRLFYNLFFEILNSFKMPVRKKILLMTEFPPELRGIGKPCI